MNGKRNIADSLFDARDVPLQFAVRRALHAAPPHGVAYAVALGLATVVAPPAMGGPFPAEFELMSLYPAHGGDGSAGFVLGGLNTNLNYGDSVSNAGDVNGDGIDDLIVGAPPEDLQGLDRGGKAFVVFGRNTADGDSFPALLPLAALLPNNGGDGSAGFVIQAIDAHDHVGQVVRNAGDVNHDGVGDLILGAPRARAGDAGESYLVFGRDTAQAGAFPALLELETLLPELGGDGSAGVVMPAYFIRSSRFTGAAVSAAGDINGDGIDDVAIAAPNVSPHDRAYAGRCYVIYGLDSTQSQRFPPVLPLASLLPVSGGDGTQGFVLNGINPFDGACDSVSDAGDVNHDGIADLVIGAPDPVSFGSHDQAYVVFGRDAAQAGPFPTEFPLASLTRSGGGDGSAGFIMSGDDFPNEDLGLAVSGIGDVNGDGIDDLAVSAPNEPIGSRGQVGRVYVVFGRDTAQAGLYPVVLPVRALRPAYGGDGSLGFVLTGIAEVDVTGTEVQDAGDVNGDGIADLIISSHSGNHRENRSYVIYGRDTADAGPFAAEIPLASLLSRFGGDGSVGFVLTAHNEVGAGYAVSGAGDVNGDGISDVIVGATGAGPGADGGGGGAFVVFGRREGGGE